MSRESQVKLKIKRAKEHVADLEQELRAFFDTNPYKIPTKRDPQTHKLIYYVASADPIPECVPLITGDIIQNLMTALDHLAYQLVLSDTGDNPPNRNRIYFPIAGDATVYKTEKCRKMEGRGKRRSTQSTLSNHTKEGMISSVYSTDLITSKSTACC